MHIHLLFCLSTVLCAKATATFLWSLMLLFCFEIQARSRVGVSVVKAYSSWSGFLFFCDISQTRFQRGVVYEILGRRFLVAEPVVSTLEVLECSCRLYSSSKKELKGIMMGASHPVKHPQNAIAPTKKQTFLRFSSTFI